MNTKAIITIAAISLLSGFSIQAQQAKNLAAPASELVSGELRLPSPKAAQTRSTSALVPVELAAEGRQMSWQAKLPVGITNELEFMLLAPEGHLWQLDIAQPGLDLQRLEQVVEASELVDHRSAQIGAELGAAINGEIYTFSQPVAGDWAVKVHAPFEADRNGTDGFLVLSDDSDLTQISYFSSYDLLLGRQVGLNTSLIDSAAGDAIVKGGIETAWASVETPSGRQLRFELSDDGLAADGAANDGVYGFLMTATELGQHTVRIDVLANDRMGQKLLRSSQHLMPILEPSLSLTGAAFAEATDDRNLAIHVEIERQSKNAPAELLAFAELWGTGPDGEMQPVAFVGGIEALGSGAFSTQITLDLDGRWLALAEVNAPFELRALRLADRETSLPLSTLERSDLDVAGLPASAWAKAPATIDETMLMGARPQEAVAKGSGRGIVLSHGYCSGSNSWPSSHFSGEAKFLDPNANRSHDTFARMLRDFGGARFSSFGLIAHSQGGAASLHLYTYYWSGLDYSSGQRLIQSVGTPYQGSGLAGTIAAIGGVFGVQCGSTFDLTYDGARLWLSGIPYWARNRVYYHTTSFTEKWWRYDYCNMGSDLFLSDPEDGVVEKWAGQLYGGHNMGHKTGWCHTTDMRDPGQTQDYSRNATMNAYANR